MPYVSLPRCFALAFVALLSCAANSRAAEDGATLARKAETVLKANCFRCHGKDGSLEGGMNYILDREKLLARKKIIPGKADDSPLIKKMAAGKMPPAEEQPRPSESDLLVLKQWIDAGAPPATPAGERPLIAEAAVFDWVLADLEKQDKRSRRFLRYFSLAPLANAGQTSDELQSYRNALAKLLNSLSWHPRITLPKPIDAQGIVLRIDLRDFMWDANLWNRLVAEYPYGILTDTAVSRAVIVATATRLPYVRLDWFVANASRPPLYYDLLQLPTNLSELERQLRVDATLDIQQERVARAGFIGSGISRNNRLIERHDSIHGAYWRTYDFDAIPQNLIERDILLPDRRNLFAYPLGPGSTENTFQHAGGEAIFNLPNGLQAYILVNANNVRIDRGPTAIVSDPKRPDRAVEVGISCINCHAVGINPKTDQIRAHVAKNAKAFNRADAELIRALYVPEAKMKALMEEDAERFRKAVEKTGNKIGSAEVVMTMTLQYEADVDLPSLAAEAGVKPDDLLARLTKSAVLTKNLGALKVPGGLVARQVVVQAFGDVVRELRLGSPIQPGSLIQNLPDNTGELDPLEAQSSLANALVFSNDGRFAAIASADKTVRIWDIDGARERRRCIGHTASVWAVAFSPDGTRLLSGSKDNSVRLWDVETGRELKKLDGHIDMVTAVAFSPDGRRALSTGYDHQAILWDLERFEPIEAFKLKGASPRYMNAAVFSPDGDHVLICAEKTMVLFNAKSGELIRRFTGHSAAVVSAVFSSDGNRLLSGSDDRTMRLWDVETAKQVQVFNGHENSVKSVAFAPDGQRALSGSTDATVRLWDIETAKELKAFRKHAEPLVAVAFVDQGRQTLSGSRDALILSWRAEPQPSGSGETAPLPDGRGSVPVPAVTDLRPSAIIPVGGTIGGLFLSPDRQWLFYLNLTEAKLGKVNTKTARRHKELKLAEGTDALTMTRDGKTLIAAAPAKDGCKIQMIDPKTLEVRKSFWVDVAAYDIAATDAGLLFLSGGSGEWTDIAVFDMAKESVVTRWGGVWNRSFLQLSADQKRVYYSSQGVSPGTLDALLIPAKLGDKPTTYRAAFPDRQPLGGEFQITADGRYLLCKTGTILRLSATREDDLKFHTSLEPFVAAAVDPDAHAAFVLTREGVLKQYSYPDFRLRTSHRLGVTAFQAVSDGKEGKLYVAGIDPRTMAERPRTRGFGEIFIYETKDLRTASKR
jgi:WD40 repeat protein